MIKTREIILERVTAAVGGIEIDNTLSLPPKTIEATGFSRRYVVDSTESLTDLSMRAVEQIPASELSDIGGVVAATFSSEQRFPSLAVSIATKLSLPVITPAFDLQMACSAYPYAVYLASKISSDINKRVLVIDGDIQSRLSKHDDTSTTPLFSDASSATLVSSGVREVGAVDFLSRHSNALECGSSGPITMDGFGVFSFVATEVVSFLRKFLQESNEFPIEHFVPHQANMYMVRQLAQSLKLTEVLATSGEQFANVGSASIPLTIAHRKISGNTFIAGFGAGLSASCANVRIENA